MQMKLYTTGRIDEDVDDHIPGYTIQPISYTSEMPFMIYLMRATIHSENLKR